MTQPHSLSGITLEFNTSLLPHPDLCALVLHGDDLMMFVLRLNALHANCFPVFLAELLQEPHVVLAEVTCDEGAWISQHVLGLHLIPQMRRQVNFTVRLPTDKA